MSGPLGDKDKPVEGEEEAAPTIPWGLDASSLAPSSSKIIGGKLDTFGAEKQKKKSPFQKHKEEAEQRRKRLEDEAAAIYADFVDSFKDEDKTAKTFVRGETVLGNKKLPHDVDRDDDEDDSNTATSRIYKPKPLWLPSASDSKQSDSTTVSTSSSSVASSSSSSKKRRAIDELKEELSNRNMARGGDGSSSRSALGEGGSFDDGDPSTTNLYVGNLNPLTTEAVLFAEFSKFGPVASVKIMWPRTDEEKRRNRNCGFVAFMDRQDAADAIDHLSGSILMGQELRVGWGKAVPLPAKPLTASQFKSGAPPAVSGLLPLPPQIVAPVPAMLPIAPPADPVLANIIAKTAEYVANNPSFEQTILQREAGNPKFHFLFAIGSHENMYYKWLLHDMTMHLAQGAAASASAISSSSSLSSSSSAQSSSNRRGGEDLDRSRSRSPSPRKERERHSSKDSTSVRDHDRDRDSDRDRDRDRDRHRYDTSKDDDRHHHSDERDRERDRDRDRDRHRDRHRESDRSRTRDADARRNRGRNVHKSLPPQARELFENMLRVLSFERRKIADAMAFSLDHSEFAYQVGEMIAELVSAPETPLPRKLACLMLVSDILHNISGVPNASSYRSFFQENLPRIFEALGVAYRNIVGRIAAENMKERVLKVLRVWEGWSIYPPAFLTGLQATFHMVPTSAKSAAPSATVVPAAVAAPIRPTASVAPTVAVTAAETRAAVVEQKVGGGNEDEDEDIDGVPLEQPVVSMSLVELRSKSKKELEWLCKQHGLPGTGSEAELLARLARLFQFAQEQSKPRGPAAATDNDDDDEDLDGEPLDGEPIE